MSQNGRFGGADGGEQEIIPSVTEMKSEITANRVTNLFLTLLYGAAIVCHVVCLAVMAAKRNEIVGKFSDDQYYKYYNIKESCMLFVDYNGPDSDGWPRIKHWVNNKCHLVIYGSAALGGCALLMIVFLIMRTLLCRRVNVLILLDAIEVVVTGLFAGVLAVIITLGKNETCKSVERYSADLGYHENCEGYYFRSSGDQNTGKRAQIYEALRTAQVTSWVAVGVICVIAMITLMRVLLWLVGINRRRRLRVSASVDPPLSEHDDHLRNVVSSSYHDEDEPLLHP